MITAQQIERYAERLNEVGFGFGEATFDIVEKVIGHLPHADSLAVLDRACERANETATILPFKPVKPKPGPLG